MCMAVATKSNSRGNVAHECMHRCRRMDVVDALAAGRTARVLRATAASPPYSLVLAASMYQSANWLQKKSYIARPASPKSRRSCAAVTRSTTCGDMQRV